MSAKREELHRVYLFTGKNDLRRQKAVEEIVAKAVDPDLAAFDYEEFDGMTTSAERILSSVAQAPAGAGMKTVLVDRVERLPGDQQEGLAAFIPKLPTRSCLVLLSGEDSDGKQRSSRSNKDSPDSEGPEAEQSRQRKGLRPALVTAVKSHGEVVSYQRLRSDSIARMCQDVLAGHEKRIESPALQVLARHLEATPEALEKEIEKLAAYVGGRDVIGVADIEALICRPPEDRVFQLIDAIAAHRADDAVRLLDETLEASTKPENEVMKVVALLGRHFRMLYQAKYVKSSQARRSRGEASEDMQSLLMAEHNPLSGAEWQRQKLFQQTKAFSFEEIRRCLAELLDCELTIKGLGSRAGSPRLTLEMLVLKLSQPANSIRT